MDTNKEKVLLFGNGINRTRYKNGKHSWAAILKELAPLAVDGKHIDLSNEFKPFPMSFEEILANKENTYAGGMKVLKGKISENLITLPKNEIYEKILESNIKNILTTNYDYAIEKSLQHGFDTNLCNSTPIYRERKTSLSRRYTLDRINIWHIHGEAKTSKIDSILIGFEQYSKYLSDVQEYLHGRIESLTMHTIGQRLKALNSHTKVAQSWVDFFFFADIDIIGLTLDFSEIVLWWVLNKRSQYIRDKKPEINNEIRYFYKTPSYSDNISLADKLGEEVLYRKQKAIVEILTALNVIPMPIDKNYYYDFYTAALDQTLEELL